MTDQTAAQDPPTNVARYGLIGAVAAAIAASICCLGPLLLVSLGATGAWIASLSALEPYRPALMLVTASFLGFAFFRIYRPRREDCKPESSCARPTTKRLSKAGLWMVTLFVIALFVSPHLVGRLASGAQGTAGVTTESTTLTVSGMTCEACSATVRTSLTRLAGVRDARVSFDPPRAIVEFDAARLSPDDLTEATAAVGYPSHVAE